jgi:homoserine O-acetyltransferase
MLRTLGLAVLGIALAVAGPAAAYDGIVEKKTFSMASYTTRGGKTIKDVKVGWESYGKLNDARDNVILVTHFFSGNSHAAGKYAAGDAAPGYWDGIIGAGKPIDTDRFFVISSDTLVNLSTKDPRTITTGPASIDPDTGKPYGMRFPVVTMRDFVEVQKALLESLGIRKLHAVVGASMGALQAFEWAAAHPATWSSASCRSSAAPRPTPSSSAGSTSGPPPSASTPPGRAATTMAGRSRWRASPRRSRW